MKVLFVSAHGKWKRPASFIKSQSDSLKESKVYITDFYFEQKGFWGHIKYYFKLLFFLRNNKDYDIIHAHYSYIALFVYLTFPKAKFVISFMGTDLMGILDEHFNQVLKGRINLFLSRFLQSKADHIIVKSTKMLDFINNKYHNITSVIPNGIDFNKFPIIDKTLAKNQLGLDNSKKYILFLADPRQKIKNFRLLNEAFGQLQYNNTELLCPYPTQSEDVYLYLNACDVLAFPSLQEGSPNVIKEALACNCPIVTTDVGDISARIVNIHGCFISAFSSKDFALKLHSALQLNARINGRESIAYLKAENVALQLKTIYHSLIQYNYSMQTI